MWPSTHQGGPHRSPFPGPSNPPSPHPALWPQKGSALTYFQGPQGHKNGPPLLPAHHSKFSSSQKDRAQLVPALDRQKGAEKNPEACIHLVLWVRGRSDKHILLGTVPRDCSPPSEPSPTKSPVVPDSARFRLLAIQQTL